MNQFKNVLLNKLYPFAEPMVSQDILIVVDPKDQNFRKMEMAIQALLNEFGVGDRCKIIPHNEYNSRNGYTFVWAIHCDIDNADISSPTFNPLAMIKDYDTWYTYVEEIVESIKNSCDSIKVKLIDSLDGLNKFRNLASKYNFAWDTETVDLHDLTMLMASFTFKTENGYENYVIPVHHPDSPLPSEFALRAIGFALFETDTIRVAHNAKFDCHVINKNIGKMPPYHKNGKLIMYDTMIAFYTVFNRQMPLGLKPLANDLFHSGDYEASLHDVLKQKFRKKADWEFDQIPLNIFYKYAGLDSYYTYRLMELIIPPLAKVHGGKMQKLYKDHLMPTLEHITKIEASGLKIDTAWAQTYLDALERYSTKIRASMKSHPLVVKHFPDGFNVASTKDMQKLFFDVLNVKTRKETKTGYSTDQGAMEAIAQNEGGEAGKLAGHLTANRRIVKMGDYLKAFLNNKTDGKNLLQEADILRPSFALHGTVSGRLASFGDFNAQNFPRDKVGVKRAIMSRFDKEGCILNVDYKTLEFRIAAALSKDEYLHQILSNPDMDLHSATASLIFKKDIKDITKQERFIAKTTNFSIIFGAGYKKIAHETGMEPNDAKEMLIEYKNVYSGLVSAMQRAQNFAEKNGYIPTHFGRTRPFPELLNTRLRKYDKFKYLREAYSMVVQSFAVDIGFTAMRLLNEEFEKRGYRSKIINQVHDSLVFDVRFDEVEEIMPLIVEIMEQKAVPENIKIPVPIEMEYGPSYEDQVAIKDNSSFPTAEEMRSNTNSMSTKAFHDLLNIDEYVETLFPLPV
jgi:DNA polymerase-1